MLHEIIPLKKYDGKRRKKIDKHSRIVRINRELHQEIMSLDRYYQKSMKNIVYQAGCLIMVFLIVFIIVVTYLVLKFKCEIRV